MADPADLGAGGTQEYPNYADDEGEKRYYTLPGTPIHSFHPLDRLSLHSARPGTTALAWCF